MLARDIFEAFDRTSAGHIPWLAFFLLVTVLRTLRRGAGPPPSGAADAIAGELPGLPLTLLHTVAFVQAVRLGDWVSMLLFAWWGPGFLVVAAWYLYIKIKRVPFDWTPFATATSLACKLNYVALMAAFGWHGLVGIPFVFSLWILGDQVRLAWLHDHADRTRRTLEDAWIPRVAYVALLFVPWFSDGVPWPTLSRGLGALVLALWLAGLRRVARLGRFRWVPDDAQENLRNIVYLRGRE